MSKLASYQECIILDADCTINLASSGQLFNILTTADCPCAISRHVHGYEVLRNDLQLCIDHRLLHVVSPHGEEYDTIIQINMEINTPYKVLGDGEIETSAIAAHRNWAVAIDDKAARDYLARRFPYVQLITTPEFIKHWVDVVMPTRGLVRQVLAQVRTSGNYTIGKKHPLYGWWQDALR
mgnify:CR=1 FL=1